MKLKTILIAGVLPLALFAKDDDLAGKIVPRLIESRNTELNQNIDGLESLSYAPEAENPSVGKFVINESSFSQKKSKRKKTAKVNMPKTVEPETNTALKTESDDFEITDQGTEEGINSDSLNTEEAIREYAEELRKGVRK